METTSELFTWGALGTIAGASLATFLFVQLTKSIVQRVVKWIPIDLYAACIAFIILLLAAFKSGADHTDWGIYVLSFLNGLLVWSLAGKMYTVVVDPPRVTNKDVKKQ